MLLSQEINNKKRKQAHKNNILNDIINESSSCVAKINLQKRKNVSEISTCVAKRQKMNPTHKSTPGRSKKTRRTETFDACMFIHGGTVLNKAPVLESVVDTIKCKFKTEMIVPESSNLSTSIKKKVIGKWNRDFYSSNENCLRSMNAYYSHNVLAKRKYLSLRKANRQSTFENIK